MTSEIPDKNPGEQKEKYKDHRILALAEGGGSSSVGDRPIISKFPSVANKVAQGAEYYSLETLHAVAGIEGGISGDKTELKRQYDQMVANWNADLKKPERKFILGDGKTIPLEAEFINEIYVENLFSDPNFNNQEGILEEFFRVLKSGAGKAYIYDDINPEDVDTNEIRRIAEKLGFKVNMYFGSEMEPLLENEMELKAGEAKKYSKVYGENYQVIEEAVMIELIKI